MNNEFNIYCDESCHLENDHQTVMVLGGVWCPTDKIQDISNRLRAIKISHGLKTSFEVKWTKVSPAKVRFYLDFIDHFFDSNDLHFRALVVPDKSKLNHESFKQSHDDWYYKMYFEMLKTILEPHATYRIYIDIKDTRSGEKIKKLHDVLCNNMYDFSKDIIQRVQMVRSHEIEILQLADLLIGAVSYINRGQFLNEAKVRINNRLKEKTGYELTKSTLLREEKFNLFIWRAKEIEEQQ